VVLKRCVKLCVLGLSILVGFSVSEVLVFRVLNPPFTTWMAWKWISTRIHRGPDEDAYRMQRLDWRRLDQISPHLMRAVLAAEDQRFLSHHGFDFVELQEALREMVSSGHKVRGASTITMQAARSVFLWPSRTWARKIAEAYYTLLLELAWSKKRTMEVYLNTVDWGEGIVGAENASRRYFHRGAKELAPSEAAMLAAILPNPRAWSPERPTGYLRERQEKILREMQKMPLSQLLL
jgi:monofunctional glycosyltransferase